MSAREAAPMKDSAHSESVRPVESLENIDFQLLNLIRRRRVDNSGNKGIILKFSKKEIPAKLRRKLEDVGVDFESVAAKIIKVFDPDSAKREFDMLTRASQILTSSKSDQELAKIPCPIYFSNVDLDDETRKYLSANGCRLGDKAGIIIMDYVKGEDLATFIYKQALLLSKNFTRDQLKTMDFNQIHFEVGLLAGFSKVGGKGTTEGERNFEDSIVKTENFEQLISYLRRKGFVLNKRVLEIIDNTIEILHSANFFHNDLHERNIMIGKKPDGNIDLYIVDFGSACIGVTSDFDVTFKVSDDRDLIRRMGPLTKTVSEEAEEEYKQALMRFSSDKDRYANSSGWREKINHIAKLRDLEFEKAIQSEFLLSRHSETELNKLLITLAYLWETESSLQESIDKYIDAMLTSPSSELATAQRKMFKLLKGYLLRNKG
jgi:hypothetical protein